ncbi:hypothetical protein K438DRAFT_2177461, partial [Mycena galopus ATCC 62051]
MIHTYNDCIHDTLSNIPWSQLSRLQFVEKYNIRFISPSQLASILLPTVNLTHLFVNLGPDMQFGQSPTRVLLLPQLHTLEICYKGQYDESVPHSFIYLFDKLLVPENLTEMKLPGLVEALTYTATDHTLLPNLVDIPLEFGGYGALLPAFMDMSAVPGEETDMDVGVFAQNNAHGPTIPVLIKTANEATLARLRPRLTARTICTAMMICGIGLTSKHSTTDDKGFISSLEDKDSMEWNCVEKNNERKNCDTQKRGSRE